MVDISCKIVNHGFDGKWYWIRLENDNKLTTQNESLYQQTVKDGFIAQERDEELSELISNAIRLSDR